MTMLIDLGSGVLCRPPVLQQKQQRKSSAAAGTNERKRACITGKQYDEGHHGHGDRVSARSDRLQSTNDSCCMCSPVG